MHKSLVPFFEISLEDVDKSRSNSDSLHIKNFSDYKKMFFFSKILQDNITPG